MNSKFLSEEKRREVVENIIGFFNEERGEKIGVIAAEDILDNILENVGSEIYNKGIRDSSKLIEERMGNLQLDVESLVRKDQFYKRKIC